MQKPIIISFLFLFILSGCFRAAVQFPEILSCEEASDAANLLTPETKLIFEGISAKQYVDKSVEFCKTHQLNSKRDCLINNKDDYEICMTSLGIKAKDRTICGKNQNCLLGYATSHPNENCALYDKKSLQNVCFYTKAHFSHERKYCDFIETKNWKDESCSKAPSNKDAFTACYLNQYKCLWGVSDQASDVSICDSMEDSFEKDVCYMSYAIKTSNQDICSKMKGTDWPKSPTLCQEVVRQPFPEKYKENGLFGTKGF